MIVSPRRSDTHPLLEIKLPAPPLGHEVSPAVLRAAVTRQGMLSFCQPLNTDEVPKIDLLIVGSVAVSRKGKVLKVFSENDVHGFGIFTLFLREITVSLED